MGQSGFDILDSDAAMDVQYHFFERYNAGKSPAEIYDWFKRENSVLFEKKIIEDCTNFWLGLAYCQWEVKALEPFVVERVKEIVESDIEKSDWEENYSERKKHLQKFLVKIAKEKKTAKKPVKQKLFRAVFEKGVVITYPIYDLDNKKFTENWGLSVCVENTKNLDEMAKSLFITSDVEKSTSATMEDFNSAYALADHGDDKGFIRKSMYKGVELDALDKIQRIGKVKVERAFCMDSYPGDLSWVFPYSMDFTPGAKHSSVFKLSEVITIPKSPYSKWGEKIVELQNLKYNDPRKEDSSTFKELADFLVDLRKNNESAFRSEFTNFIADYLFTPTHKVHYIFRSIVKSGGHDINSLE